MIRYSLAVFLSAFLLFQVQPLMGKYILPWFGGTPAVWTTCMLFFQLTLFAGYCYAHGIVHYLSHKWQAQVHGLLLLTSAALLPIAPNKAWITESDQPIWQTLLLLLVSVGGPYFMLAATAPLLQSWYHRSFQRSPYRLYALSNIASLAALFSYPLIFERILRLKIQAWGWSISYLLFVVICGSLAMQQMRCVEPNEQPDGQADDAIPPTVLDIVAWLCLSACGSIVLLTTTNQLTMDVAAVPFLWVLPLALYVLTFVICFDAEHWYRRKLFHILLAVAVSSAGFVIINHTTVSAPIAITCLCAAMFVCCMICHGELVRLKPAARYLTTFYLMVSLGGALGGLIVTLLVPLVFVELTEFPISIALTCVLALASSRYERYRNRTWLPSESTQLWRVLGVSVFLLFVLGWVVIANNDQGGEFVPASDGIIARRRNFYGVLKVERSSADDPKFDRITLSHGTTLHGYQFQASDQKDEPTAYYARNSGVGLAVVGHPKRVDGKTMRVGVVGLGCGTLSVYMGPGDYLRYYEINPDVVELSRRYFSFQSDAQRRGVDQQVHSGDARIVLEQQLHDGENQQFDVLVLDAFSSDSIPIHLMTMECFKTYTEHLAPDGILAFHVSNNYLDLMPVLRHLAKTHDMSLRSVTTPPSEDAMLNMASEWALCTTNQRFLIREQMLSRSSDALQYKARTVIWTDDYSNLFSVLRR